jgi:hypothetical protein
MKLTDVGNWVEELLVLVLKNCMHAHVIIYLPSGKLTYGKLPLLMGKSTINGNFQYIVYPKFLHGKPGTLLTHTSHLLKVLEEDPPDAKNIDLRHLDIDWEIRGRHCDSQPEVVLFGCQMLLLDIIYEMIYIYILLVYIYITSIYIYY